ncbi:hypothetical protein ES288_A09G018200v1 [Gossypium darwinii]|uniref:Heparanase-like protein 2 n=1 Tax=Gossypium darwinii TaxID=34276 RepID=A0A5D2F5A7_GOSDA|nr:hypothetical protein ES288_A09G018200v1 [Gossypium darwinii]
MDLKCIFSLAILVSQISLLSTQNVNVVIQGATSTTETDDNFVCAVLDWWSTKKCNYNQSFNPLRIKVGGSLQDQVVYGVGGVKNCPNFMKNEDSLFGFSQGYLSMEIWEELNKFFNQTGLVTFGLNALLRRNQSQIKKGLWVGDWKSQNTRDLMKYTISRGYKVDSYEFENQLSGVGIGASVEVEQYGKDIVVLKNLVKELNPDPKTQPKVLGPIGYYDEKWFNSFLEVSEHDVVDGVTHHIYCDDPNMITKIQDPSYLNQVAETYKVGPWISESGKALHGGAKDLSPTSADGFCLGHVGPKMGRVGPTGSGPHTSKPIGRVEIIGPGYVVRTTKVILRLIGPHGHVGPHEPCYGFWAHFHCLTVKVAWVYLDQLGMASTYNHKVFCRQTLIGGNYALLNTTTSIPNLDYFGALLWHRLMGSTVLAVTQESNPNLHVYAHCAKKKPRISIIFIHLSKDSSFNVTLSNYKHQSHNLRSTDVAKPNFEFRGSKDREEYHLVVLAGNIQGQIVLLNDTPMVPTETFNLPVMEPKVVNASMPISIVAHSMVYVTIRDFQASACA